MYNKKIYLLLYGPLKSWGFCSVNYLQYMECSLSHSKPELSSVIWHSAELVSDICYGINTFLITFDFEIFTDLKFGNVIV